MPRAGRRKIDPDQVYESWCAFAADGLPGVIATGTRLRGSDPVVKAHPHWFVPAGTPPSEWPAQLGTTKAPEPTPDPTNDIALTVEPRPLQRVVETTRPIKVLIASGAVNLAGGLPGRLLTFDKGTRFKSDAEVVTRLPDNYFREV